LRRRRRQSAIAQQYAGGDTQGAETAAIGAGEFDLAKQLTQMDDAKRTKTAAFFKAAGPLAYKMRQMTDPAQRKAFLDANRPMLEAEGVNPQAIDSFDVSNDQALDGLIAGNQTVDQLISQNKIEWQSEREPRHRRFEARRRQGSAIVRTALLGAVGRCEPSRSARGGSCRYLFYQPRQVERDPCSERRRSVEIHGSSRCVDAAPCLDPEICPLRESVDEPQSRPARVRKRAFWRAWRIQRGSGRLLQSGV
jgi:hypothetical protein